MTETNFGPVFKFIVEKCCSEKNPGLMEASLNAGIKILHQYSCGYSEYIVSIFEDYLKNSKNTEE
jgi:hypothetical protein